MNEVIVLVHVDMMSTVIPPDIRVWNGYPLDEVDLGMKMKHFQGKTNLQQWLAGRDLPSVTRILLQVREVHFHAVRNGFCLLAS